LLEIKKIKDVSDIRDESSKGKTRIVIEFRKGANPDYLNNSLYKYTRLQDSFSVNFLALVGGKPKVLNIGMFWRIMLNTENRLLQIEPSLN
jgi:DNA gyrase subunit A